MWFEERAHVVWRTVGFRMVLSAVLLHQNLVSRKVCIETLSVVPNAPVIVHMDRSIFLGALARGC